MPPTLLVPVDSKPGEADALPVAEALAKAMGLEVDRVHIETQRRQHHLESAEHTPSVTIGDLDDRVAPAAVRVSSVLSEEDIPSAIVDEAIRREAKLIVMATRARGGISRFLLGSVADEVLAKSPVPVVVVRVGDAPLTTLRTLLVPVDGTPGGSLALGIAIELARATSARMVILRVVTPEADMDVLIEDAGIGMGTRGYVLDTWDRAALEAAQHYVQQIVAPLAAHGVVAEGRSMFGSPARTIADVADDVHADLIVMSTHARGRLARTLLGSVAGHVVRSTRHPVMLVRRQSEADASDGP